MVPAGSRYAATKAFAPRPDRAQPWGVRPREIVTPDGAVEHVLMPGDRLDLLARQYYGDDQMWWHILDANPDLMCAADLLNDALVGRRISIPAAWR